MDIFYLPDTFSRFHVKLFVFVILLSLSTLNSNAQIDTINPIHDRVGYGPLLPPGIEPTYILKIDTLIVITDTSFTKKLNPEWIRRIVIVKDCKYKSLFSPPLSESSILLIIRRKYCELVNSML
jgi:hypothetical protein